MAGLVGQSLSRAAGTIGTAMAEQLTFRLEAALPRPGDVAPMWPKPHPEPFDAPDWLFEPTWGGHRALAFVEPGSGKDTDCSKSLTEARAAGAVKKTPAPA